MDAMLRSKAEELAKEIAVSISTQQELGDVMRLMTKSVIERMLDAEMDVYLDEERGRTAVATTVAMPTATTGASAAEADADRAGKSPGRNRRNGKSGKTVQGESGRLTITTPRDRNGAFEPRSRALRQGHEHSRHPRVGENALRRGTLGNADFQPHRRRGRGSHGVALAAAGTGVADRVF